MVTKFINPTYIYQYLLLGVIILIISLIFTLIIKKIPILKKLVTI